MYCEQCGSFIPDGQAYCSNCGAAAPAANTAPAPAPGPVVQPIIQTPAQPAYQQPAYQQPVYQQPQPVQPIYQQPAYQQAVVITPFERPKSNVVAVVGLVFGILTCVISWLMVFNIRSHYFDRRNLIRIYHAGSCHDWRRQLLTLICAFFLTSRRKNNSLQGNPRPSVLL